MTEKEIEGIEDFLSRIQFDPNPDDVVRLIRVAESLLLLAKEKDNDQAVA